MSSNRERRAITLVPGGWRVVYSDYASTATLRRRIRTSADDLSSPSFGILPRPPAPMTDRRLSVHLDVDPLAGASVEAAEVPQNSFEIVLLGDFSARGSGVEQPRGPGELRAVAVDRDDFDEVLAQVAPRVRLALGAGGPAVEIEMRQLDDFHPDGLFDRAALFGQLRSLRRRALDSRELSAVAAELGMGGAPPEPEENRSGASAKAGPGGLLDQILEKAAPSEPSQPTLTEISDDRGLSEMIRRLVAPHLVSRPDPRQAEVLASIDAAVGDAMRMVLHHPAFQAVESLWRALFLLVRRVETGSLLRIRIVDVTQTELNAELSAAGESRGELLRLLRGGGEAAAAAEPALLVAAYSFGAGASDLALLHRLAELGREVGAPCLTAGDPGLLGASDTGALATPEAWEEPAPGWDELRRQSAASYLGVCLPRILLRMPYGEDADECETFGFEELSASPGHEEYLWGNPAIACAILLAQSFSSEGWNMRPGLRRDLEGLPLPLIRKAGEVTAQPSAEVWLGESAAERMLEAGIIPLVSIRDRGTVRVVRFQSIAEPPSRLAGRWSSPPS